MVWRTYRFPDKLWQRFEVLRIKAGVRKKQDFFLMVIERGLQCIEEELEQKELEEKK